jgi:isocitrate/isopropylmalate dehydrogenase
MAKRTIVIMPGDGIGNQVLPEAIRVLDAVGFEAGYVHADIGWECWTREGNALPERTIDLLRQHKVGLFGAITSKPKKEAEAELNAALRGKGHQYFSPIVSMRQKFNLDICMRPCLSFPGNPLNFIRKKPAGGFEEPKVDTVIFRQNTEGSMPESSGRIRRNWYATLSSPIRSSNHSRTLRARTSPSRYASSRVLRLGAFAKRRFVMPASLATRR